MGMLHEIFLVGITPAVLSQLPLMRPVELFIHKAYI